MCKSHAELIIIFINIYGVITKNISPKFAHTLIGQPNIFDQHFLTKKNRFLEKNAKFWPKQKRKKSKIWQNRNFCKTFFKLILTENFAKQKFLVKLSLNKTFPKVINFLPKIQTSVKNPNFWFKKTFG